MLGKREKQEEAVGIHVTALCVCLCISGHVCVNMCCTCVSVCVPTGNAHSTSLLVGPGGMELWQPHPCWAAGFCPP